jgi:hypothetical protein
MEKFLSKIERAVGHKGIPDLSLYIVAGQVLMFLFAQSRSDAIDWTVLSRPHVLNGEVWRLVTFLFIPPSQNMLLAMLAWYVFYSINKSLEMQWGTCRHTIYLGIGYIATIVGAFIGGSPIVDNNYFLASTFLAFATLYPDIEFLLFFIIPVKVQYLGIFTWAMYLIACFSGGLSVAITIIAGVLNYLIFFGGDLYTWAKRGTRRMSLPRAVPSLHRTRATPRHQCITCGATDSDNPDLEFRYCSKCTGNPCFCIQHLDEHKAHQHTIH